MVVASAVPPASSTEERLLAPLSLSGFEAEVKRAARQSGLPALKVAPLARRVFLPPVHHRPRSTRTIALPRLGEAVGEERASSKTHGSKAAAQRRLAATLALCDGSALLAAFAQALA